MQRDRERIQWPQGESVSRLGLGTWAFGGHGWGLVNEEACKEAVRVALRAGVNLFDTADIYGLGRAERLLGQVLAGRRDAFVSTKVGLRSAPGGGTRRDATPEHIADGLHGSLQRLGLHRIPLYFLHWPDPGVPLEETWNALKALRGQGLVGYLGASNVGIAEMQAIHATFGLAAIQAPFSLLRPAESLDLIRAARALGIRVMAYDVLGKGLLSGRFSRDHRFAPDDVRLRDPQFRGERLSKNLQVVEAVCELARKRSKTPAQVAIRWVLDSGMVDHALVGCKTPEQFEENAGAMGWQLRPADVDALTEAATSAK